MGREGKRGEQMKEYDLDKIRIRAEEILDIERKWITRYKERENWEEFIRQMILVEGMEFMFEKIFDDDEEL